MRRWLLTLALVLAPVGVMAQGFIHYYPPQSGSGGGTFGDLTPLGAGIPVDTDGSGTWVARCLAAGAGVSVANACGAAGNITVSTDFAVVVGYSLGAVAPSAACSPLEFYGDTTGGDIYWCNDSPADHWNLIPSADPTDDNTFVGSGTTFTLKAIPDCDDSVGQHLNYDTTTNAYSCGTTGASAAFVPSTTVEFYDDFMGGTTSAGTIGNMGIQPSVIATGTTTNNVAVSAAHPGLYRILSHATNDNSGGSVNMYNSNVPVVTLYSGGPTDWTLESVIIPGSNSTSIASVGIAFGIVNAVNVVPESQARGAFIRYDTDRSDATYIFQVCDAAGAAGCAATGDDTNSKVIASTKAPSGGVADLLRIRYDSTGVGGNPTLYMSVGHSGAIETEKTFCSSGCDDLISTFSATDMYVAFIYVTRTTTGVISGDIDYLYLKIENLVRY